MTKTIYYTPQLGRALARGAHIDFKTQHEFVVAAIREKLAHMGDAQVTSLLEEDSMQIEVARDQKRGSRVSK